MNKPMTLEDAVEIDRLFTSERALLSCTEDGGLTDDECARWDRARAIVDQAVRAHKARVKFDDDYDYGDEVRRSETYKKLRALERGEEVQP